MRRALTVRLRRELAERTHDRNDNGAVFSPETQAAGRIEEGAVDLVGGVTARAKLRAQRKLLQQTNRRAARRAAELSQRMAAAIVKTVASAASIIAGLAGGAMLLPVIAVIVLAAALIVSPFGILFSNEPTPNAIPLSAAVEQINQELADTLESLQTGDYDAIDLQGQPPDWREVVAVFAAKTTGDGADVAALTPERVDRLRAVFWDMCAITSEVKTVKRQRILCITITPKTADEMRTQYAFTAYQNKALTELLGELAAIEALLPDFTTSAAGT